MVIPDWVKTKQPVLPQILLFNLRLLIVTKVLFLTISISVTLMSPVVQLLHIISLNSIFCI